MAKRKEAICAVCAGVAPKGKQHPCRFNRRTLCSCWHSTPCGEAVLVEGIGGPANG